MSLPFCFSYNFISILFSSFYIYSGVFIQEIDTILHNYINNVLGKNYNALYDVVTYSLLVVSMVFTSRKYAVYEC